MRPTPLRAADHLVGTEVLGVTSRSTVLGPAEVLDERTPTTVTVRREDGAEVEATLALALTYRCQRGDEVLLIGDGTRHWVIGVVAGRGAATLSVPGDLDILSGGQLRIAAEQGVELAAPQLTLRADSMRVLARAATQVFDRLDQAVAGLLHVRARRQVVDVEETAHTQARRATILSREEVTINGKTVHLG